MIGRWFDTWRSRRQRRARGRAGEQRVAAVLDEIAELHGVKVRHRVPLQSRRRRHGDLDHAVYLGRRPCFFVAIETKAEQPRVEHLQQARANARRAGRRHFRGVPHYRIVVHPNSAEPVTYDAATATARMGLPFLPAYLLALLEERHRERLAQ